MTEAQPRLPRSLAPQISIITVCFNPGKALETTMASVIGQRFPGKEYIVIDGGSTDGSQGVIRGHEAALSRWVSEPDRGIYDAMNKGISLARGEWLLFMNAGDEFLDSETLGNVFSEPVDDQVEILYSDTYLGSPSGRLAVADLAKREFVHQSMVYRKALHLRFGPYLVYRGITLSDYVFFCVCLDSGTSYKKLQSPISVYDATGVSTRLRSVIQRLAFELMIDTGHSFSRILRLVWFPPVFWLKQKTKRLLGIR